LREQLGQPLEIGGRGEIRTHGGFNPTLDFESSALNRTQPPFLFLRASARAQSGALTIKCGTTFVNSGPIHRIRQNSAKKIIFVPFSDDFGERSAGQVFALVWDKAVEKMSQISS
jgi:hypothetical protein